MKIYCCRFVDAAGHVFGDETMEAKDDTAVIARAHVIFAHGIGSGYEIWDDGRLVHREARRADVARWSATA